MKTKRSILSLGLATALVGTLALPAPKAHAGNNTGPVLAGALIGGLLGYIIGDSRGGCDTTVHVVQPAPVVYQPVPVVYQPAPVVYQPAPVVYQPAPVVVHRPVVYQPAPVIVHRPVVVAPPPPVIVHRPVVVAPQRPPTVHYGKPGHRPADYAQHRPGGGRR